MMDWHCMDGRRIRAALGCIVVAAASAGAQAQGAAVAEFDERTLTAAEVSFQRGVFRIDEASGRVVALCIPVKGAWKRPGTLADCGPDPAEKDQRESERHKPDVTVLEVRNLGVDSEEWHAAKPHPTVMTLKKAFSYQLTGSAVSWKFDSRPLPAELRAQIPGSGIQAHFGGVYSTSRMPDLFERGKGDLQFEARIAVPTSVQTGRAHAGLSLGVVVHAKTTSGKWTPIPILVNLFNKEPARREAMRNDGRSSFAQSQLGPSTRYVTTVRNEQKNAAWSDYQVFAFKITRDNIRHIVKEMNGRGKGKDGEPVDLSKIDEIRVSSILIRNECRFLDQGDVQFEVLVDYLKAYRTS